MLYNGKEDIRTNPVRLSRRDEGTSSRRFEDLQKRKNKDSVRTMIRVDEQRNLVLFFFANHRQAMYTLMVETKVLTIRI